MIKILQLVGGGDAIGGVEKMLLNYYSFMDRSKIIFDFCFYRKSTISSVDDVQKGLLNKSRVFDLQLFEKKRVISGYYESINKVKSIIKENDYDIVHINAGRPPLLICGLIAAKKAGTRNIIIHSHSTKGRTDRSLLDDIAYEMLFAVVRPIFRKYATMLAGCSTEAAKYMFGSQSISSAKYFPIRNAIVVNPLTYNEQVRQQVRAEIGVSDNTLVIGHVGSFSTPKNHIFLVNVFNEIKKKSVNCQLWLAGNGVLKVEVELYVKKLGIESDVLFLGERSDTTRLYQAMDVMVFPSLWEGLSVSVVEAQAASLPVFASSNISIEHQITDNLEFLDLSKGAAYWANYILYEIEMKKTQRRRDMTEQITKEGYNIEIEAKSLQDKYLELIKFK